VPYTVQFEDCLFDNFKSNNGATGTAASHAISDAATPYHAVILRGNCQMIGCAAWADPVTYTLQALPLPHANGGISIVGA
jgi:phosphate/sulfate permease